MRGIMDLDFSAKVIGRVQRLIHELLDIFLVDPGSSQPDLDLRSVQVLGLGGGQGLHIALDLSLLIRGHDTVEGLGHAEFFAHIAG